MMETYAEMTPERQAQVDREEDAREALKNALSHDPDEFECEDTDESDVDETNFDPYAGQEMVEPPDQPENEAVFEDRYEGWNDQYDEVE